MDHDAAAGGHDGVRADEGHGPRGNAPPIPPFARGGTGGWRRRIGGPTGDGTVAWTRGTDARPRVVSCIRDGDTAVGHGILRIPPVVAFQSFQNACEAVVLL